jgi:hypothetical protein
MTDKKKIKNLSKTQVKKRHFQFEKTRGKKKKKKHIHNSQEDRKIRHGCLIFVLWVQEHAVPEPCVSSRTPLDLSLSLSLKKFAKKANYRDCFADGEVKTFHRLSVSSVFF